MKFDVMPVATEKQMNEIEQIASDIWYNDYKNIFPPEQIDYMLQKYQSKAAMKKQMAEHTIYYMLFSDNCFAGYVAFQAHHDHIFINRFCIKPEFRRRGLAKRTIHAFDNMVSGAEFRNINKLRIMVEQNNNSAIAAYEHLGFQKIKEVTTALGNHYFSQDYLMERKIQRKSREDFYG